MAWNPEPKVKVAREYGQRFDRDVVLIFALDVKTGKYECISYGKTKALCTKAEQAGDELWETAGEALSAIRTEVILGI